MNRFSNDLDDMTLPQRPRRPDPRREVDEHHGFRSAEPTDLADDMRGADDDHEFTLSTGTVLALFFALALVCAMFFGFGYSMGKKSAATAAAAEGAASNTDAVTSPVADTAASKPSAGSPAIQAIPSYQSQGEAAGTRQQQLSSAKSAGSTASVTVPLDSAPGPRTKKTAVDPDGEIVEAPASQPRAAAPVATSATGGSAAAGGPVYVQIAAVSHKEDADVLLSALKRRGYNAFTRTSDGDRFIHVQVGPFADKKEAEAMRQRLLGDGYNAMLK